jgi:hypothetical protein
VLQFSFTLTASRSKKSKSFRLFFGSEIWALCFILLFQEIPFFLIRLGKLIKFKNSLHDYSIYFYVAKNFLLCLFEIYRILVIFYYHRKHLKASNSYKNKSSSGQTRSDHHNHYQHHHRQRQQQTRSSRSRGRSNNRISPIESERSMATMTMGEDSPKPRQMSRSKSKVSDKVYTIKVMEF